jgi:hypothetical protein
MFQKLL